MKALSPKSLLFYGSAIVSVGILFSMTTSYGETYLKAATPIAGDYVLSTTLNTDNCLDKAVLKLDQSGRYLTAALLLPTPSNLATPLPPTFSGIWPGQFTPQGTIPLSLIGTLPEIPNCYARQRAWIQGTLEKQAFSGNLIFANGTRIPFRSQIETKPIGPTFRSH